VLATIPVGRDPGALAVGNADVWVTNTADHTVSRIDPRAKTTLATLPVAQFPIGAVIGDGAVWIASRGAPLLSQPAVSRIDVNTNDVVETTAIGGTVPIGMAAGDQSLWIASRSPDEVLRMGPLPVRAVALTAAEPPPLAYALGGGAILVLVAGEVLRRLARQDEKPTRLPVRYLHRVTVRRESMRGDAGHQGASTHIANRSAGVLLAVPCPPSRMAGPGIQEGQPRVAGPSACAAPEPMEGGGLEFGAG
jgi:streptogramin lyase